MKTRRGFTLLECVIVLTIAIVLGVFLFRSMFTARENSIARASASRRTNP